MRRQIGNPATPEYGGEGLFTNWLLARLAKGRATIAGHEAGYQRSLTSISVEQLEREYQVFLYENRVEVARLATAEGMDVLSYSLAMFEKAKGYFEAQVHLFKASVDDHYEAKKERRRLGSSEADSRLKVAETRQMNEAETENKRGLDQAEVDRARDDIATEDIDDQRNIRLGLDINRKVYAKRQAIGQEIADVQAKIRAMKRRADIDDDERADRLFQYEQDLTDLRDERESLRPKKKGESAAKE